MTTRGGPVTDTRLPLPEGSSPLEAAAVLHQCQEQTVNNIIWWVGAIVIILAILGFLAFR